jgi:hypothetical protein
VPGRQQVRLVGAVLAEQHQEWACAHRYIGAESPARTRLSVIPGGDPLATQEVIPELAAAKTIGLRLARCCKKPPRDRGQVVVRQPSSFTTRFSPIHGGCGSRRGRRPTYPCVGRRRRAGTGTRPAR